MIAGDEYETGGGVMLRLAVTVVPGKQGSAGLSEMPEPPAADGGRPHHDRQPPRGRLGPDVR